MNRCHPRYPPGGLSIITFSLYEIRIFCCLKGGLVTSVLSFSFYRSFSTDRHQFHTLHVTNLTFLQQKIFISYGEGGRRDYYYKTIRYTRLEAIDVGVIRSMLARLVCSMRLLDLINHHHLGM